MLITNQNEALDISSVESEDLTLRSNISIGSKKQKTKKGVKEANLYN